MSLVLLDFWDGMFVVDWVSFIIVVVWCDYFFVRGVGIVPLGGLRRFRKGEADMGADGSLPRLSTLM